MGYTKRTKLTRLPEPDTVRLKKYLRDILSTLRGEPMRKIVTSPVKDSSVGVEIARGVERNTGFDVPTEDENGICEAPSIDWDDERGRTPKDLEEAAKWAKTQEDEEAERIGTVKFADQIKIDFIPSIDFRILCRFLGVTTVGNVKNHPYQSHPLITLILMESLERFMKSKGFDFVGELNFDQHGNSIPPDKNPWSVQGKETTFTTTGFLYFESKTGDKKDNVSYFVFSDLDRGGASITCYSTDTKRSKDFINDLQIYAKQNNCLRGAKLKDVNMISASFSEVELNEKYTWDNYYFPESIKTLFELEVLGFIQNVEKYNACGITKRGIILHGLPGTGKTTIGNVICNLVPDHTVIWITPEILSENNYRAISSIKALYKLADFLSPCIIILEDLDLFSQDRERGGDIVSLGALMNVLDGVNSIANSVTIGTTNRLSSIETALRNRPGRFDRIIEIPSLTDDLRRKMFKERLKDWKITSSVLDYLIEHTKDWTGAEVQELVNSLHLKHISTKRKMMKVDMLWAEDIIETMGKFGVGEASSNFGFSKNS